MHNCTEIHTYLTTTQFDALRPLLAKAKARCGPSISRIARAGCVYSQAPSSLPAAYPHPSGRRNPPDPSESERGGDFVFYFSYLSSCGLVLGGTFCGIRASIPGGFPPGTSSPMYNFVVCVITPRGTVEICFHVIRVLRCYQNMS